MLAIECRHRSEIGQSLHARASNWEAKLTGQSPGTPLVWITMSALAQPIRQAAEDRFDIVGPWNRPDWEDWLGAGGAEGIRVAITSGMEPFRRELFDRLPDLETIVVFGAGNDGIDLDEAAARGIVLYTAGATHCGDVADQAIGLIIAARRGLLAGHMMVRAGDWPARRMPPGRSVGAARVGIVGLGNVGRAIAERLSPFGSRVRWWGPTAKPEAGWERAGSLLDLADWCDVLVISAYGKEETRGLITREIIDAVGRDGLIVNVSRGFVADQAELIAALQDGRLGQLATDVFEIEPDDGQIWRDVPNVILTPHVAGDTVESFDALCQVAVANVERALGAAPRRGTVRDEHVAFQSEATAAETCDLIGARK